MKLNHFLNFYILIEPKKQVNDWDLFIIWEMVIIMALHLRSKACNHYVKAYRWHTLKVQRREGSNGCSVYLIITKELEKVSLK
jgi:hypothetical protein